jgi:hypothetical protein
VLATTIRVQSVCDEVLWQLWVKEGSEMRMRLLKRSEWIEWVDLRVWLAAVEELRRPGMVKGHGTMRIRSASSCFVSLRAASRRNDGVKDVETQLVEKVRLEGVPWLSLM